MLSLFFSEGIALSLAQAGVAFLLVTGIVLLARQRDIHIERDALPALLRGILQVVAVGSVLLLIFRGPLWTAALVLLFMAVFAANISARRAKGIPGAFVVSLCAIGLGAGVTIPLMTWLGVIEPTLSSVIPLGSMMIANAMNVNALVLNRFRAEIEAHVGQIEAGLALGADPKDVVQPHSQAAVYASLIPRIDSMRSLGIVWIPGVMTGMILAGSDPVYAAIYQFVVMAMIFSSSALTSLACTLLIRPRIFSPAEQLLLRAEG